MVICKICFIVEGKEKLLVPKLDFLINTQGCGSAWLQDQELMLRNTFFVLLMRMSILCIITLFTTLSKPLRLII
jgi:hypothetical protein